MTNDLVLTSTAVLDRVRARTGLDSIDVSNGLIERLDRLMCFVADNPDLDEHGKSAAFETVSKLVEARSRAMADRVTYPEITEEVIDRPIFVVGMGRSGTTLMHSLVGVVPGNRVPLQWDNRPDTHV